MVAVLEMKKVDRVEYDMEKDPRDYFTKEHIENWCRESRLPLNYFDLPVQEARDALIKRHREIHG